MNYLDEAKKLIAAGDTKEGGFQLLRAYRGIPKNKALIKFLSEEGIKMLLQKTENFYMQDNNREMPKIDAELYYVIDEKNNQVELTDKGVEYLSGEDDPDFFVMPEMGTEIAKIEAKNLSSEEEANLKEDLFREFVKDTEWSNFDSKTVALFCSVDAIIPAWAFMLVATELKKVNSKIYFGSSTEVKSDVFFENLSNINITEFTDQRVMVKGCSDIPNPNKAYVDLTNLLVPAVKSLMFGEPCSAVPVFKRR